MVTRVSPEPCLLRTNRNGVARKALSPCEKLVGKCIRSNVPRALTAGWTLRGSPSSSIRAKVSVWVKCRASLIERLLPLLLQTVTAVPAILSAVVNGNRTIRTSIGKTRTVWARGLCSSDRNLPWTNAYK